MPTTAVCATCDTPIDISRDPSPTERTPCPKCGSTARKYDTAFLATLQLKVRVAYETISESVTRHRGWWALGIALTVAGAVGGHFLNGYLWWIPVAVLIGVCGMLAKGKATTRTRTITRGGGRQ
jgi:hypothetical protein